MRKNRRKQKRIAIFRMAVTLILVIIILVLGINGLKRIAKSNNQEETKMAEDRNAAQNTSQYEENNEPSSTESIKDNEALNNENWNNGISSSKTNSNATLSNETANNETTSNNANNMMENNSNTVQNTQTTKNVSTTTTEKLKNGLPVLMYHFFYDKSVSSGADNNWMEIGDFENQMKYLSENNFYFPTWEEVEQYIDGKKELPEKSVVITVDDGDPTFFDLAVPIIQKYNVQATSFIVTEWYGYRAGNKEANISYQSHSDRMHEGASNGKGVMLSWSYDKILEDVTTSSKSLGGATIFCYPFGQYNDLDKKVLKDAGYKLAFTTEGGRVYKESDKYALPRVRMSKGVSLSAFKEMVK